MPSQSRKTEIDNEKLKKLIKSRPRPSKLVENLDLTPTVKEDDIIFQLPGSRIRNVLRRRANLELTDGEKKVLFFSSHGLEYSEIAEILHISKQAVTSRAVTAKAVLQAKSLTHAVGLALRAGLID